MSPGEVSARPWNVFVGHRIGLGSGLAACLVVNGAFGPLCTERCASCHASSVPRWRSWHSYGGSFCCEPFTPPAAGTALLVTLSGSEAPFTSAVPIALGILTVTVLGEGVRRLSAHVQALERRNLSALQSIRFDPRLCAVGAGRRRSHRDPRAARNYARSSPGARCDGIATT